MVGSTLDGMETVASRLFPAWLPGAEGITSSAGAGVPAIRGLALTHAAGADQYGPFLADLAARVLGGLAPHVRRYQPEVRARGLAQVIATSFGRRACALLLRPPQDLDERGAFALVQGAQWLVDHAQLAVWIAGEKLPGVDWLPEVVVAEPVPADPVAGSRRVLSHLRIDEVPLAGRKPSAAKPRRRGGVGGPHPTSRTEVALEAVLADRPWAAGRAWNHTIRPGPLVNPVRVDLLWKRERCIVEIDGDDHRTAGKYAEDRRRDVMLQLHGYAVLRFTNTQVLDDTENVLALLQQFLASRRRARKGS